MAACGLPLISAVGPVLDPVFGPLKQRVGIWLLNRTMRNGIDLRKLRFLPESVTLPLKRDGLDPLPAMMEVQAEAPVKKLAELFGKSVWLVSGYEESREVLAGGAEVWSNDLGQFVSQEGRSDEEQIGGLGMTDPPLHTTLRRYLTPEFTMRRLARLQPGIEAIVAQRLDAMEAAGRGGQAVDMVEEFAFAVPFDVICDLLGLPVDDRARFLELGVARFDLTEGGAGAFGAAAHTREFLINAVREQRANPGDGLIGALLKEHGDELDDVTLGGIADGVFLGGYETSASMLALGAYLIATTPKAGEMLRSGEGEQVNQVIEELLRHLCVVQLAFLRFAKQDVEVGGVLIKEGDAVGVSLPRRQPRPRPRRRPRHLRPEPRAHPAPRLRLGHAPLRRRRARPDGAAHRAADARRALPESGHGRRHQRPRLPQALRRVRRRGAPRAARRRPGARLDLTTGPGARPSRALGPRVTPVAGSGLFAPGVRRRVDRELAGALRWLTSWRWLRSASVTPPSVWSKSPAAMSRWAQASRISRAVSVIRAATARHASTFSGCVLGGDADVVVARPRRRPRLEAPGSLQEQVGDGGQVETGDVAQSARLDGEQCRRVDQLLVGGRVEDRRRAQVVVARRLVEQRDDARQLGARVGLLGHDVGVELSECLDGRVDDCVGVASGDRHGLLVTAEGGSAHRGSRSRC